ESPGAMKAVVEQLDEVCDIERIVARIAVNRVSPRDLAALSRCLSAMPALLEQLQKLERAEGGGAELLVLRSFGMELSKFLAGAIKADPAPHMREGGVIAEGFDAELDRLREIGSNSQQWLARYQAKLAGESGITSLKVGYNKVFGYYIEVTDSH